MPHIVPARQKYEDSGIEMARFFAFHNLPDLIFKQTDTASTENPMRKVLALSLILLLSISCSRIPEPIGYEHTTQAKMQAAYHWDVLASDVANRINNELIIHDYTLKPVYVKTTCGDEDRPCEPYETSTFNEAFRDLLITELVRFGVPVRQHYDEEAITVHYKVQLVYHSAARVRTMRPGLLTALTAGIMVLRNAPVEFLAIGAAGIVDYMNTTAVNSSKHEVLITTSMVAKDRYLFRSSDIYYINDKDFHQYQGGVMPKAAEIQLVAPDSTMQSTPKNIPDLTDEMESSDELLPEELTLPSTTVKEKTTSRDI